MLFISFSMSLYNAIKDVGKKTIVAGSLVAMLAGCSSPTLEQNKDLTGDKIPDAIVSIKSGPQNGTWLFIGQEDGSFVRATQYNPDSGVKYFKTDDGTVYFFDGEFYKPSPNQK
jgi:hypothetical protein